jgi:hypothetical protein
VSRARGIAARLSPGVWALSGLLLVLAATTFASQALRSPVAGIDDANIFFVYARNVAAGEGFVFNAGGERVEGFTSLLWVLISSGVVAVAGDPEPWLLGLNVLLVALAIIACLRSCVLAEAKGASGTSLLWGTAFLIALLLDFRFVAWNTVTLMETALWTALLTTATVLVIHARASARPTNALAVLVPLLVLTRPEALAWVPALCGLAYLGRVDASGRARARSAVLPSLVAFATTAGIVTILRLAYFGEPLPNTYYAKVAPSVGANLREGAAYLEAYVSSGPVPLACVLAVGLSMAYLAHVRGRDHTTRTLTALAALGLIVPVLTGGDHFDGFRFYQSLYPILLLALVNTARVVLPRYVVMSRGSASLRYVGTGAVVVLLAGLVTVQLVQWTQYHRQPLGTEFDIASAGRQQGRHLNLLFDDWRERPDVGTIVVGGLQYAYRGDVIDLMGLNNTAMAHNGGRRVGLRSHAAFEKSTFYALMPTIVLPLVQYSQDLDSAAGQRPFVDLVLKGLLQDTRFQARYRLAEVRRARPEGVGVLAAWFDREFLADLTRSADFDIRTEAGHELD